MKSRWGFLITCVTLLSQWCNVCHTTPLLYNISMDGSGDEAELELLFPTSFSTRAPVLITAATGAPTLTNTITTTMIRLKDFVLTRVVDFLQENLLIIIVVTSLLIVMVFIICCASAMSHKRKLEAYKPPPNPPRKYAADKTGGRKNSSELQERPYTVDHVKRVQTQSMASPKNLRTPSKARWLLSGRLKMATDLVCTEPVHLAHSLLLNLSVMAICPHVLKPHEGTRQLELNFALERKLETLTVKPMGPNSFENKRYLGNLSEQISQRNTVGFLSKDAPKTRVLLEHYSLETFTYETCLSLNKTQSVSPPHLETTTSLPDKEQKCRDITGRYPQINATSAEGTRSLLSTNRDAPWPTPNPRPFTQPDSAVFISLLAILCVLVSLLILAVLLVLKKVLLRQQRVAPLNVGSGG